jgi:hypothetical protein
MQRVLAVAGAPWGSTQTTSTPAGLRKSTSQSSVVSRALIERAANRREPRRIARPEARNSPSSPRGHSRGDQLAHELGALFEPATMIRLSFRERASASIAR